MNLLFFPVVVLAAALFAAGYWIGTRVRSRSLRWLAWAVGVACAVPGVLFATYYLHLFDDAGWFYEFRSWPLTELAASGAGLLAGLVHAWIIGKGLLLRPLAPLALLAGLFVPYMKPVIAPLDVGGLSGECRDGVCLQSTASTCGPASAASILRLFDVREDEKTLAREALTSSGGTENWYLARALRRRGFSVKYVVADRPVKELPVPSVAGVLLPGGGGHYISVLAETSTAYVVGDPMHGRVNVPKSRLGSAYQFTGFFMVVGSAI